MASPDGSYLAASIIIAIFNIIFATLFLLAGFSEDTNKAPFMLMFTRRFGFAAATINAFRCLDIFGHYGIISRPAQWFLADNVASILLSIAAAVIYGTMKVVYARNTRRPPAFFKPLFLSTTCFTYCVVNTINIIRTAVNDYNYLFGILLAWISTVCTVYTVVWFFALNVILTTMRSTFGGHVSTASLKKVPTMSAIESGTAAGGGGATSSMVGGDSIAPRGTGSPNASPITTVVDVNNPNAPKSLRVDIPSGGARPDSVIIPLSDDAGVHGTSSTATLNVGDVPSSGSVVGPPVTTPLPAPPITTPNGTQVVQSPSTDTNGGHRGRMKRLRRLQLWGVLLMTIVCAACWSSVPPLLGDPHTIESTAIGAKTDEFELMYSTFTFLVVHSLAVAFCYYVVHLPVSVHKYSIQRFLCPWYFAGAKQRSVQGHSVSGHPSQDDKGGDGSRNSARPPVTPSSRGAKSPRTKSNASAGPTSTSAGATTSVGGQSTKNTLIRTESSAAGAPSVSVNAPDYERRVSKQLPPIHEDGKNSSVAVSSDASQSGGQESVEMSDLPRVST